MTAGFLVILTLALLGSLQAPWWTAALGAACLTAIASYSNRVTIERLELVRAGHRLLPVGVGISLASSAIAASFALLLGRFAVLVL